MDSKGVLLLWGVLLLVTTEVSSADNEVKLILKAPIAKVPTPAPVKAPAPAKVPVKAPPTTAPVTTTPPPLPPVTKPPTTQPLPPSLPPVAKPPTTQPPVTKPLPPPLSPVTKPPPAPPLVMPPAAPPLPPVRSKADCIPLCDQRCQLHSRKNVCTRACMTCCDRCKCVPPGTYGNRERCGKCYTDMTTHGNRIKCP